MAIRIIYDQTLAVTANGEVTGWIKVQDVTQVVPGCLGFIYDQDTGPVAIRIEAIDGPNSKLQLSIQNDGGTYVIGSLTAYTVASASKVKIPQQAREDSGYVPPAGGAIAGIVAGGSTAGSGFVTFANSNGLSFGMSNNVLTASGGGGGAVISAGTNSQNTGTVVFSNSNGLSFGLDTNGALTGSYTVPTVPPQTSLVFSNSNNVSFGTNGSTVTASASYPAQTSFVLSNSNNVSFGTNGSTVTAQASFPAQTQFVLSNSNGLSFGTNGSTVTGSYTVPTQTSLAFSNSNNVSFGLNGSTLTATATFPAQTVQPVAASASNGSFNFSTLRFVEGSGVTWATQAGGIQASVKTDYQSSNPNYLTSQSNQAVSGSNGSFAFQTLSLGASNGVSFYTTNGSIVASYTVPTQTVQPVAASGSNGSFAFSTLSFGASNGVTFATSNGSIIATVRTDYQSAGAYLTTAALSNHSHGNPTLALTNLSGTTASASNGLTLSLSAAAPGGGAAISAGTNSRNTGTVVFANSNGVTFGMDTNGNVTATVQPGAAAGLAAVSAGTQQQTSGTLAFVNSNGITFGMSNSSQITASHNGLTQQSTQPVAVSGSNGSFAFSTLSMGNSNGLTFYTTNGSLVGSYTVPAIPGATVFSNSNNVSFGLNGSTITATATFNQTVQTQNSVAIQGSSGNISFGNANGITFGANASTITASHNALTSQSNQAVSAANGSFTFQTLTVANSNGVSFSTGTQGLYATVRTDYQSSNANYLTSQSNQAVSAANGSFTFQTLTLANSNGVSFSTGTQGVFATVKTDYLTQQSTQPVAVSGANGSFAFSTLTLANSNGVSFSTGTQGVYATVKTDYQSSNANYLTSQSVQPVAASGSNGSFAFSTLSFGGSNGLTFYTTNGSLVGSYTVPNVPAQTSLAFSNSNNVSFGINGSTLTATATFNQTAQTLGVYGVGNTVGQSSSSTVDARSLSFQGAGVASVGMSGGSVIVSVANAGGADGFNRIAAGTQTAGTLQTVVFSNSNNVSFSMNGSSQVVASATFAQSTQPVAVSGSNGSFAFSTLTLGNSNGLSFYSTNGSMVGSYTVPSQTVQPVAVSGSNGSFVFSTLSLGNSNGASFYTTNGSIALSYTVPVIPGATVFSNSNNVSFGLNGSTVTATATFAQSVQTQNLHNVTLSGNTAGVMAQISSGTLTLAGGNNITLSQNGNAVTISGPNVPAQTVQPVAVSGSNGSFAFSTLTMGASNGLTFYTTNGSVVGSYTVPTVPGATVFSNSNNVSFGLNGSTITATATFAQSVQPVAVSGANGSFAFSTLTLANSNGVSFSTGTQGVFATVRTDYQSSNANYLTSQSNQAVSGANGSFTFQTLTLANSNGVSFSTGTQGLFATVKTDYLTQQSTQPVAVSGANGSFAFSTLTLANSNGVSFSTGTQGVYATVKTDYLTTARASNDAIGLNTALTGNGVSVTANSSGLSINVPAFLTTAAQSDHSHGNPTLALTNLSGTTASASNGFTLSLSAAAPGAGGGAAIQGSGTYTQNTGTVQFANSNGVTFGLSNNGVMTASVQAGAAAGIGAAAAGTQTQTSGTLVFANSNNITFGMSNSSQVTASFVQSNLTGGTNITLSSNGSTISVIGPTFANSNGITFGVNGQTITASHNGLTTAALSNHSHGNPTLALTNISGTTASASNGLTLSLSAAAPGAGGGVAIADGASTITNNTLVFSNVNGVSFGLNGSTMTASVNAGGMNNDSHYPLQPQPLYSSSCYSGASGNTGGSTQWTVSGYLSPLILERPLYFSDVEMYVSAATVAGTGSMSFGHALGFYSLNGGTAHSLISSFCWQASMSQSSVTAQTWHQYRGTASSTFSTAANGNISASYTGMRQLVMHQTSQSLPAGTYYLAHIYTARSGASLLGANGSGFYYMPAMASNSTYWTGGARMGTNTTAPPYFEKGMGIFSTTTNQSTLMLPIMPASINTSALTNTGGSSQWRWNMPILYL